MALWILSMSKVLIGSWKTQSVNGESHYWEHGPGSHQAKKRHWPSSGSEAIVLPRAATVPMCPTPQQSHGHLLWPKARQLEGTDAGREQIYLNLSQVWKDINGEHFIIKHIGLPHWSLQRQGQGLSGSSGHQRPCRACTHQVLSHMYTELDGIFSNQRQVSAWEQLILVRGFVTLSLCRAEPRWRTTSAESYAPEAAWGCSGSGRSLTAMRQDHSESIEKKKKNSFG